MPGDAPPEPYVPESLLELIDEQTLEHLITGFREKLRTCVSLYCREAGGHLKRIDPEGEAPKGRQKYWPQICREFRSTKVGNSACREYDELVVGESLDLGLRAPQARPCGALGLTEIVAQIVVLGRPLGAVVAGQRLPPGDEKREKIRGTIHQLCPERAGDLEAALDLDYAGNGDPGAFSLVCDEEGIHSLLLGLENFANLVSTICERVAQREEELRRNQFLEHWINELTLKKPTHLTAWARALQQCLASFWTFVSPGIERIGLFYGQRAGDAVQYSLVAMNSSKWWQSEPFRLPGNLPTEPAAHEPGCAPDAIRLGVGMNIARLKHLNVYPFWQVARMPEGEVFSLVVIQTRDRLSSDLVAFCQRFCLDLCRRDATTRLFTRQLRAARDFEQHVIEKRHDLKTNVQHVVGGTDRFTRKMRKGMKPDSAEGKALLDRIERSIEDHVSQIEKLTGGLREPRLLKLESVGLFTAIREQVYLFLPVAEEDGVGIDEAFLPKRDVQILCETAELKRAIAAILDNAIKYSYNPCRPVFLGGTLFEQHVEFWMENYGIGIPPDKLGRVKQRSVRAAVPDLRVHRKGSGLGLAIAAYVFVDLLGGDLKIASARDPLVQGLAEDFHRYVTRVEVTIPRD